MKKAGNRGPRRELNDNYLLTYPFLNVILVVSCSYCLTNCHLLQCTLWRNDIVTLLRHNILYTSLFFLQKPLNRRFDG